YKQPYKQMEWPRPAASAAGTPAGPWNFIQVAAVAATPQGNILVLHRGAHPIMEFDAGGRFLRSWGDGLFSEGKVVAIEPPHRLPGGSAYSAVYGPAGCTSCGAHAIRVDARGNVWLVDATGHVVYKTGADGRILLRLGTRGVAGGGPNHFNLPTDVAVAPDGAIYVSDGYGSARVVKFSATGRYLTEWGRRGTGPGEFGMPHNVATDAQGRVYVSDRDNRRVQVFDANGKFLQQWDTGGVSALALTRDGRIWTGGTLRDLNGKEILRLSGGAPHGGVALTESGDLYFALLSGQVLKFAGLRINVLSGRPDMVTGGSALLSIEGPGAADGMRVLLNGKDVTTAFQNLTGRVEGLAIGRNRIEVSAGGNRAQLELTNHPITGPVFSGPHQVPFLCETEAAGLGPPLDANCSAKTRVEYFYKAAGVAGMKPLDPSTPRPAGVDFIVRRETGTINRAIYSITLKHEPGSALTAAWNRRLIYSFGGGCRAGFHQARPPAGFDEASLARGYAMATSSLNVFGNNCNDVISAETLMMVKEHFIKNFGVPVYTIGSGGSGGSMQQHLIAQNYPGLLDGITPAASYPDILTIVPPVVDCSLLTRAFEGGQWTEEQKTAVSGFATWKTCASWTKSFSPALIRPGNCDASIPAASRYHPVSNPKGVRCTVQDNHVNIFGRDARGFALRALDNDGVQYGLAAFNAGTITAEQFVGLNERVGGYDADGNLIPGRTIADSRALRTAYRTGRVNSGGGSLGAIPIIDFRRYLDRAADIHDSIRSRSTRARLIRANTGAANHVILINPRGANGPWQAVWLMDEWLENIRKDASNDPPAVKIARNKPAGLKDGCWSESGEPALSCEELYPVHSDPRMVAGAPLAGDILKCALKPLRAADYSHALAARQLDRLKAVFPRGVCDYSRPGIGQTTVPETWLRY
ncbi:MAG: DUF6351 family protein, partial [Bryobacteraceae bacterium]|nr:DUF6351 family protein [Bryobacteraceae bacterium]